MWRFRFHYRVLKYLCYILRFVGFLKLRFDRPKQLYHLNMGGCCLFDYLPGVLLVLLNFIHLKLLVDRENYNAYLNELEPNSRPNTDEFAVIRQFCHNVAYVWIICRCLCGRSQLWYIVQQAQSTFKHLSSELRQRLVLKCSWLLFILGVVQILLLLLLSLKLFWFDWPQEDENGYNVANYIMGLVHLLFALLLTLQLFYHLLHAALLQSLYLVVQQLQLPNELHLLGQVLHVQPLLSKMHHHADYYFRATFCWFFFLLCWKSGVYVSEFSYDENVLFESQKSLDDLEDEAEWSGLEVPPTRGQMLASAALELTWQAALLLPLICAAHVQQKEYNKLFGKIWKTDFPRIKQANDDATPRTIIRNRFAANDILSFLDRARVPLVDYHRSSLSFMAWKPNPNAAVIQLAAVAGGCKILLHVLLCTTIVDFVQQMELMHLQNYLKASTN